MYHLCWVLALLLQAVQEVHASITLPNMFTDSAVFQRDIPVPVWGTATAGETITVQFDGQTNTNVADAVTGYWEVALDSMPANNSPQAMTVSGTASSSVVVSGIQVGEVWFGGGQSNMRWKINEEINQGVERRLCLLTLIC